MADLSVTIGGDASDLEKELRDVEKQLRTLERRREARVRIGADIGDLDRRIAETNAQLGTLRTNLTQTGAAAQNFNRQAGNGSNTLTQFSRIAQDAPFGIMGIGNNLTATAEAFANLSRSSGGAGNALRAVGQSLLGGGGILLAISLVTTALTVMSQKGITVGDVFDKLAGNFDNVASSMKKAVLEASKSAIEETNSLRGLISVAQDETQSRKARIAAVDELQNKYPSYFGNLSKEQVMTQDLTSTVNELSRALVNRAIAEKLSKDAAEPTLELWKANARLIQQKKELNQLEEDSQKSRVGSVTAGQSFGANYYVAIQKQKGIISETRDEIIRLTAEIKRYEDAIAMASKKSAQLLIKAPKTEKEKVRKRPKIESVGSLLPFDPAKENAYAKKELALYYAAFGNAAEEFKNKKIELNIPLQPVIDSRPIDIEAQRIQGLLNDLNKNASELIQGSIADTFGQLGTVIGESLATGGNVLQAIGQTLLQGLGSFLSDMGGLLIQYGTLAVVKGNLDLAIATGGPVAIAAGAAAIAVGVLLKAAGGAIASKAKSGGATATSTSGGSTGADYQSPVSRGGFSGGMVSSGGTVVFEIAGNKLIGVLNNTLNENSRLGGATNLG